MTRARAMLWEGFMRVSRKGAKGGMTIPCYCCHPTVSETGVFEWFRSAPRVNQSDAVYAPEPHRFRTTRSKCDGSFTHEALRRSNAARGRILRTTRTRAPRDRHE